MIPVFAGMDQPKAFNARAEKLRQSEGAGFFLSMGLHGVSELDRAEVKKKSEAEQ